MGKISGSSKFRKLLAYLPGLLLMSLGIYLVIQQPLVTYVINQTRKGVELREGTATFEYWKNFKMTFKIWIFEVTNPGEIMTGGNPVLKEVGPFVYDSYTKRKIISVDEELDEVTFTSSKTFHFNKEKSGDLSEDTEVTILNFGYIGTVKTIASDFGMFLRTFGPIVHTLFVGTEDIFIRAKAGDILFNGLPLDCSEADPKLAMLCTTLRTQPPALLKQTETLDLYLYSLFYRVNGTQDGPFTVNRGVKNYDSLGNTTSFKNMRITKYWKTDTCNTVMGADGSNYAPMDEKLPFIYGYESQLCRWIMLNYTDHVLINDLWGYQYEITSEIWDEENMDCYTAPPSKKTIPLPRGVMDITKCQGIPVLFSEPHYLHGAPELWDYAEGLKAIPMKHKSYVVIEPLTGLPLQGAKMSQLSLQLFSEPKVPLFKNLTTGIFPMIWTEEASTATIEDMHSVIDSYRLLNISSALPWIPIALGLLLIIKVAIGNRKHYQITFSRYPRGAAFE